MLARQIFAVIGLLFLGTATGAAAVTMMVELIQTVNQKLGKSNKKATEKASALYLMSSSIGSILGTVMGAGLYELLLGVVHLMDVYVIISTLTVILYVLTNIWPGFCIKKPRN